MAKEKVHQAPILTATETPSTTYKDSYGQSVGSSSSYTDSFGNTTTQQRSNNENTSIWSW